ncbi:MAG: FtsX-like permease family protein [Saprospiraceae bacterium]|nr:FtsX-like permease family protein [Saprospiraceae bacterium]
MSWRNIWRNRTRSLVVITAIALGIWAAMFMSGFATGMVKGYLNDNIANAVSHIQIHNSMYSKENDVKLIIPDAKAAANNIEQKPNVKAVSVRTLVNGMIASSKEARGIRVKGIDPEAEAKVSTIAKKIIEGEYLDQNKRNPILISNRLAERLDVKLRSKVVLTFQDLNGEIIAAAFRVTGIFDTGSDPFDEMNVFALSADLNRLLSGVSEETDSTPIQPIAHEMAIILQDAQLVDSTRNELQSVLPNLKVETYREISPDLQLYESQMESVSLIYLVVIMLALIFGIINTMLMAVLERIRELGMLMAIGMNKRRVFIMIMLETILIGLVAAPFGLLLGSATIAYLGKYGINLSAYSETLQMYGMSNIIYFAVNPDIYWQVPLSVAFTAVLASLYPAWKAIRLKPVEAIRKI